MEALPLCKCPREVSDWSRLDHPQTNYAYQVNYYDWPDLLRQMPNNDRKGSVRYVK